MTSGDVPSGGQGTVGGASGSAGTTTGGRIRSKTFEEYEKYTTDAWGDEEDDASQQQSVPADLESELKQQQQRESSSSDSGAAPNRRRVGRGKGE